MLNVLDTGTNRKADIVRSLMNLRTRRTLGTAMLKEQRFGDCSFFTFLFLLDIHGSNFVLGVSCAPNIEPSSTGRSDRECFLCNLFNSHFGLVFLTSCRLRWLQRVLYHLGHHGRVLPVFRLRYAVSAKTPSLVFIEVPP